MFRKNFIMYFFTALMHLLIAGCFTAYKDDDISDAKDVVSAISLDKQWTIHLKADAFIVKALANRETLRMSVSIVHPLFGAGNGILKKVYFYKYMNMNINTYYAERTHVLDRYMFFHDDFENMDALVLKSKIIKSGFNSVDEVKKHLETLVAVGRKNLAIFSNGMLCRILNADKQIFCYEMHLFMVRDEIMSQSRILKLINELI